jgi:hypothetical protein
LSLSLSLSLSYSNIDGYDYYNDNEAKRYRN